MKTVSTLKSYATLALCVTAFSASTLLMGCAGQSQRAPKEPIVGQITLPATVAHQSLKLLAAAANDGGSTAA